MKVKPVWCLPLVPVSKTNSLPIQKKLYLLNSTLSSFQFYIYVDELNVRLSAQWIQPQLNPTSTAFIQVIIPYIFQINKIINFNQYESNSISKGVKISHRDAILDSFAISTATKMNSEDIL